MLGLNYGMIGKHLVTCLLLVVIAVLVGGWILNFFGRIGIGTRVGKFDYHFTLRAGSVYISQTPDNRMRQGVFWVRHSPPDPEEVDVSLARWRRTPLSPRFQFLNALPYDWKLEVPTVVLLTALVPLLVWHLTRFRFALWKVFAFTAVVAVEFAYFSR